MVPFSVSNLGNTSADGVADLQLFASTDGDPDNPDNILLSTLEDRPIKAAPGAARRFNFRTELPADIATGDYFVLVVVDATDAIDESDEDNNAFVSAQTIHVVSDIVDLAGGIVQASVPPVVQIGGILNVDLRLENLGTSDLDTTVNVDVLASLSGDPFDAANVLLETLVSLPVVLPSGQLATTAIGVNILPNVTPGDYFLVTHVDAANDLFEADEQNNLSVTAQFVTFDAAGVGGPVFLADSADLVDVPFFRGFDGRADTFTGQGIETGNAQTVTYTTELLLGVNTLKVEEVRPGETETRWYGQDETGKVWLFKEEHNGVVDFQDPSLDQVQDLVFSPALEDQVLGGVLPPVGSIFDDGFGNIQEVLAKDGTLPHFPGETFIVIHETQGPNAMFIYVSANAGLVAEFFGDHSTPATNDGFVLDTLPALPALTDLAGHISEQTLAPFAPLGGLLNVDLDLANLGTVDISTSVDVEFHASMSGDPQDPANTLLDTLVGLPVNILAGQFLQTQVGINVPVGLAAGDYFLVTKVDSAGALIEDNEQNNMSSTFQFVTFDVAGGAPNFLADSADLVDVPFFRGFDGRSDTFTGQGIETGNAQTVTYSTQLLLGVNTLKVEEVLPGETETRWYGQDETGKVWLFKEEHDGVVDFQAPSLDQVQDLGFSPDIEDQLLGGAIPPVGMIFDDGFGNIQEVLANDGVLPQYPGENFIVVQLIEGPATTFAYWNSNAGLVADFFESDTNPTTDDAFVLDVFPSLPAITDLSGGIDDATLPATGSIGGVLNVDLGLQNLGTLDINTIVDVEFHASVSGDPLDPGNVLLDTLVSLSVILTSGHFSNTPVGINVPVGLTPGDYFLVVKVDSSDLLAEDNELNNVSATFQFVSFS